MSENRQDRPRGLPSPVGGRKPPGNSATARHPHYASQRDAVKALMRTGEPFGEVEVAIDGSDLNEDARAALWLLAFSMRQPRRDRDPRAHG